MSGLIYKKMSQVMADIGAITKDQKNVAQGFKFRGIDQFVNALYPALVKHGVFMTPRVVSCNVEMKDVERSSGKKAVDKHVNLLVEYDFYAEDGSKVTIGPVAGEGLDSGDKATNKAMSAALKYALIQTFSIPTEDLVDADKDTPEISLKEIVKNTPIINKQVLDTLSPVMSLSEVENLRTGEKYNSHISFEKPKKPSKFERKTVMANTGDDI